MRRSFAVPDTTTALLRSSFTTDIKALNSLFADWIESNVLARAGFMAAFGG